MRIEGYAHLFTADRRAGDHFWRTRDRDNPIMTDEEIDTPEHVIVDDGDGRRLVYRVTDYAPAEAIATWLAGVHKPDAGLWRAREVCPGRSGARLFELELCDGETLTAGLDPESEDFDARLAERERRWLAGGDLDGGR